MPESCPVGRRACLRRSLVMRTILIVDDEKPIREAIRNILEYVKYRVVEAENGKKALDTISADAVDGVLLDIKMAHGMDGLEVLREIKRMNTDIPVVMISGHGTFETAVEATKLGAFDYLPKPLDREKLLIVLRNALEQHSLAKEIRQVRGKEQ